MTKAKPPPDGASQGAPAPRIGFIECAGNGYRGYGRLVCALVAYLLYRNDIVSEDAVMDAGTLPAVRMPARDRFVPDDRRRGGPEVR